MKLRFFVVLKRDDAASEVFGFETEADARALFERLRLQWSQCFLTQIIEPLYGESGVIEEAAPARRGVIKAGDLVFCGGRQGEVTPAPKTNGAPSTDVQMLAYSFRDYLRAGGDLALWIAAAERGSARLDVQTDGTGYRVAYQSVTLAEFYHLEDARRWAREFEVGAPSIHWAHEHWRGDCGT